MAKVDVLTFLSMHYRYSILAFHETVLCIFDDVKGWNQRHDEKIPHSVAVERFLPHTPANVEKAKVRCLFEFLNTDIQEQ